MDLSDFSKKKKVINLVNHVDSICETCFAPSESIEYSDGEYTMRCDNDHIIKLRLKDD